MAGFSSIRDIDSEINLGKYNTSYFSKIASSNAGVAGKPEEWFTSTGSPGAITFSGTAGIATQLNNLTSGALSPLSEGSVSPEIRYLLNFQVSTSATTITPGSVILADLLLYYPSLAVNTTETALDNSVTLPRYTDGNGVMALCFSQTTPGGSQTYTLSLTDSNNASQTATAITVQTSPPQIQTINSIGGDGSFIQFPGNALGIKTIDSYICSSSGGGTMCIILLKPLAIVPINAQSITTETDFVHQFTSLPKIYDGACLGMFIIPGGTRAASAPMVGSLTYGWG